MATITLSGKVVYASPPGSSEVPAPGVTVTIIDKDTFTSDDVIFTAVTDGAGNFDGESAPWDDQVIDSPSLQIEVSERQYGVVTSPKLSYRQLPGERVIVVLPWGPPNLKNFGEILVVAGRNLGGNSIYGTDTSNDWDYGNRLMALLYTMPPGSTPVFRGSHDFWVTIPIPPLSRSSFNRAQDTLPQLPWHRPYGGLVHLNQVPDINNSTDIAGKVGTIIHEVGHKWLVPADIEFDDDGNLVQMLTEENFWQAVNNDTSFSGATMLGRDNSHWSPFWHADRSVMDGVGFVRDTVDGDARWVGTPQPADNVHVDGLPDFALGAKYNHLEQVIIGMRDRNDAYPESGGRVRWIEPRLTAPLPYLAGLFIMLANDDFIEFGYQNDHRTIAVVRNGKVLALVDSDNELQRAGINLDIEYDNVLGQYRFSVGADPAPGCAAALADWLIRLIGGTPILRPPEINYLLVLDESRPAVATGVLARSMVGQEIALEAAFSDLTFNGPEPIIAGTDIPLHEGELDTLPELQWRRHLPASGPIFRVKDGEQRILLPRVLVNEDGTMADQSGFDRDSSSTPFIDRVPKIAIRPKGAFKLSGRVRIHRSTIAPRSGARAFGLTIWGREKSAPVSGIKFSRPVRNKQDPPPNDTHKVAYIIVAPNFADVSDDLIARVDGLRRAADAGFDVATDGKRHLDSSLD
jgi:hypothetical protein